MPINITSIDLASSKSADTGVLLKFTGNNHPNTTITTITTITTTTTYSKQQQQNQTKK